jgi:hypothetical protein
VAFVVEDFCNADVFILHAAMRAEPDTAPLKIVFCYQNNLAHLLRLGRVWSTGFYVGTFGEYSMQAVRNRLAAAALHLLHRTSQARGGRGGAREAAVARHLLHPRAELVGVGEGRARRR